MTPYYADDWLTVYQGDCREVMASMEPASVHMVCTSPPYWGLRDYGTATWIGGEELHEHVGTVMRTAPPGTPKQASNFGALSVSSGDCSCGAIREDGQLGLEPTPEAYVADMVAVFREIRRVLRDDGTVWLNLGDSYAGGGRNEGQEGYGDGRANRTRRLGGTPVATLKPKDLVGIPWRVAFALQSDGWYLRSDIIWSKPNPMPESVTDRPTKAHEYLFLLSKSPRYYYDGDAVREADAGTDHPRAVLDGQPSLEPSGGISGAHSGIRTLDGRNGAGRNLRSVWSIATQPYPGAHFATFPEKLVEPCVKAGTSERGVCSECGAPWRREVERIPVPRDLTAHRGTSAWAEGTTTRNDIDLTRSGQEAARCGSSRTPDRELGWRPSCAHGASTVPGTVLDPFAGSGTTGRVAQRLGRRAVLIDLSAAYLVQAMARNQDIPLGLETA